ncbi:MAG: ABC transporter permease, partial [Alphaproteobacteria bacterium]
MADTFFGRPITPLTRRRLRNFRANKRGYWSLWIFLGLFSLALFAEFIANNKPLLIGFNGEIHVPVFFTYP